MHIYEVSFQINKGAHLLQDIALSQEIQFVEQFRQDCDKNYRGFL